MDYCSGGSVRTLLKAGRVEEKYSSVIMREMLVALQYIHKEDIIHRDIKAANVLISREGGVQLCDFGVAAQLSSSQHKRTSMIGTPYWMAPEVIKEGSAYNQKADIWSLGITLYEIITGSPPYADQDIKRAVYLIPRSKPTRLEGSQYTPALKEFVAMCLDEEPDARPSAEDLLKSKLIKGSRAYSSSILKDLILRYQQWREKNKHIRDSFLASNGPGASFSDEEEDDASSFDWDFETSGDNDNSSIDNQRSQETAPFDIAYTQEKIENTFSINTNSIKSPTEAFSQDPTFRAVDPGYFSPIQSIANTMSGSLTQMPSSSFGITEKHPLLEIFEEEGDEESAYALPKMHTSDHSNKPDMSNDINLSANMTLPPTINTPMSVFSPQISAIQTPMQGYAPMEIEIPSLNAMNSHPMVNNGSVVPGQMNNGPTFPMINSSYSVSNSYTSASTPNLTTLLKASNPQSMMPQIQRSESQVNTMSNKNLHNPPGTNSFVQGQSNPQMNGLSDGMKSRIAASASEADISASYTCQAPPSIASLTNMSRRTPSPKRGIRQASVSTASSTPTSRKASLSQWQGPVPTEEGDSNTSKQQGYTATKSSTSQASGTAASSASSLSLSSMAETTSEDGSNIREVPLSTTHLKNMVQRKLSVSSNSQQGTASRIKEQSKSQQAPNQIALHLPTNNGKIQSQMQTSHNESLEQSTKSQMQQYHKQQYNKLLQHSQQQQLKESLLSSDASIPVPFSVSVPQDTESSKMERNNNKKNRSKPFDSTSHNSNTHKDEELAGISENGESDSETNKKSEGMTGLSTSNTLKLNRSQQQKESKGSTLKQSFYKPEKLEFPVLRELNCNILLDAVSKEAVVNELSLQLGRFSSALDIIDKQLSTFMD